MSCPRVIKVCGIGLVGPAGKSILSGNGAPTVAVGTDGEFYIDLTASRLYGPKMSGAWGAGTLLKGDKGDKGDQGDPVAWQQGAGVPGSGVGETGDFYLNTSNGDIYGPKTSSGWGSVIFNIAEGQAGPAGPIGPSGPAGSDGRTILSGTTAPSSGTGSNGDYFINTNGPIIYGPKTDGVWPSGVSLIGPAGATGPTGPEGPQGPQGDPAPGTNLSYDDATRTLASSTGDDATLPLVTTSAAGLAPQTGASSGKFLRDDANWAYPQDVIVIPVGDETTALTTGTYRISFRMPFAATLLAVRASVNTAPTGSTLIVDINEAGTSVLGTKLSIDAGEFTSTTAASAATITDSSLADDAEISIDIDQIGSTVAGAGLKVSLFVRRA
jgi:hypothetical protein